MFEGFREFQFRPLQGVVEAFGERIKVRIAMDQTPLGVDAEGPQNWHLAAEQFRHAAAGRCGIDLTHPDTFELLRQSLNLVDQFVAHQGAIVVRMC